MINRETAFYGVKMMQPWSENKASDVLALTDTCWQETLPLGTVGIDLCGPRREVLLRKLFTREAQVHLAILDGRDIGGSRLVAVGEMVRWCDCGRDRGYEIFSLVYFILVCSFLQELA